MCRILRGLVVPGNVRTNLTEHWTIPGQRSQNKKNKILVLHPQPRQKGLPGRREGLLCAGRVRGTRFQAERGPQV